MDTNEQGRSIRYTVVIPAWVMAIRDDALHNEIVDVLTLRAIAVALGCQRRKKGRELLRQGDKFVEELEIEPRCRESRIEIAAAKKLFGEAEWMMVREESPWLS